MLTAESHVSVGTQTRTTTLRDNWGGQTLVWHVCGESDVQLADSIRFPRLLNMYMCVNDMCMFYVYRCMSILRPWLAFQSRRSPFGDAAYNLSERIMTFVLFHGRPTHKPANMHPLWNTLLALAFWYWVTKTRNKHECGRLSSLDKIWFIGLLYYHAQVPYFTWTNDLYTRQNIYQRNLMILVEICLQTPRPRDPHAAIERSWTIVGLTALQTGRR